MATKKNYTVNVGNIGNIECSNKKDAITAYREYVNQSCSNYGRASAKGWQIFTRYGLII